MTSSRLSYRALFAVGLFILALGLLGHKVNPILAYSPCTPPHSIHRVSLTTFGQQGNGFSGSSGHIAISSDGRYVAFKSQATNLVPNDTNNFSDVFVYDRLLCSIERVSVSSNGVQANSHADRPSISSDGRYVAFQSQADNLIPNDTNNRGDIFLHDRQAKTTTRVSLAVGGGDPNGESFVPSISSDGRYIAFTSLASNLVPSDTNGVSDVFVYDRQSGTTSRVSMGPNGTQSNGDISYVMISSDGRYVAFDSLASNLVANDTNGTYDVFVHDRLAATTIAVSVATGGVGNGQSAFPTISADGRYVAFQSTASNLISGDTNNQQDVFVRDLQTGTTMRVSVALGGGNPDNISSFPAISADGHYVVFTSSATNLIPNDSNAQSDIFVYDRQAITTTRVSLASTGGQATGGNSGGSSISADGWYVVFDSLATNLVANDTNTSNDIFVAPIGGLNADRLAVFNAGLNQVNLLETLQDNPPLSAYILFSAYAPVTGGQWVMGDWDGDGLKTPGVYANGPFFYTNQAGESQASDWRSLWIGVNGPPVAGHFAGGVPNDCIGAVQSANLPPSGTAFVLYFTCDLSGTPTPAIAYQWLSVVLPDSGGFSGPHQFGAGDFNGDGVDSIAVRRGTYIAFGNVPPTTNAATFDLAQYIGTPLTSDGGLFLVGDWNGDHVDSFGLFYQSGEFFYRNDLQFNSGVYGNQSITPSFATTIQAASWR